MRIFSTGSALSRRAIAVVKLTALIGAIGLTVSACTTMGTANAGYHTERESPNPHSSYKTVPDKTGQ